MDETSEGDHRKCSECTDSSPQAATMHVDSVNSSNLSPLEMLSELIMNYSVSSAYIVTTAVSLGGDPERQLQ